MKKNKLLKLSWLDAWIENELTDDDIKLLENPRTVGILVGFLVFENEEIIALAAEKVIGRNEDISWRAVTFVLKSLIIETQEL